MSTTKVKTLLQTLLLSCLLVQTATAAVTRLSVRQDGNVLTVQGKLDVPVNQTVAWAVLSDYPRFPAFTPGITGSRILEQEIQ